MSIDPQKWFWLVGNKPDQVFSGPAGEYVGADDAGYAAFIEAGNAATRIFSDGELADVLAKRDMPAAMIRAAGGIDWGAVPPADQMKAALAAGVEIVSTGTPALNATYDAAGPRWAQMMQEVLYSVVSGGHFSGGLDALEWPALSGDVVFADPAHLGAVARAIGDRITAWQRYVDGRIDAAPPGAITIP